MAKTTKPMGRVLERALEKPFHPTYDITKSYEWNYRMGPLFKGPFPPKKTASGPGRLLDFDLNSKIGIAAGPLLNSKWIQLYSRLGFDILTYKTVRTHKRLSNPKPNCVFINTKGLIPPENLDHTLFTFEHSPKSIQDISITNSFGVPSRKPNIWQEDVRKAKSFLQPGQVFVVSVMGSSEIYPDLPSFVKDFAVCAAQAKDAGADIIELDLSCPNSNASEGMVFLDPELSSTISKAVKAEINETPLFIKLGFFTRKDQFESVIRSNAPYVEGIVGINTLRMKVLTVTGRPAIPGRPESGVCGAGIKLCAKQFIDWLLATRKANRYDFVAIGVGGIMTPEDILEFFETGIDAIEVATAPMWDPYLAYRYQLYHSQKP